MNSREKGCRGERDFRDVLNAFFGRDCARRSAQYCGKSGEASDVICTILNGVHFEVKRTEKGNPYVWYEQACRDAAPTGKLPIVAHKRNREPWLGVMAMDDLLNLLEKAGYVTTGG